MEAVPPPPCSRRRLSGTFLSEINCTRSGLSAFRQSFAPQPQAAGQKRTKVFEKNGPARVLAQSWSGRPGSNRRHSAWEADVLPLNYSRNLFVYNCLPLDLNIIGTM